MMMMCAMYQWVKGGSSVLRQLHHGCPWKQALFSARFRSSVASASSDSELSGDIKPYEDIPGPKGLPYFGTYFHYKFGKLCVPCLAAWIVSIDGMCVYV